MPADAPPRPDLAPPEPAAPESGEGPARTAQPLPAATHRVWQTWLLAAAVGLVYLVVQFDKPVHIDDTHYLYAARHLLEEPMRPLTHEINWVKTPEPAYTVLINPPVYFFLRRDGWRSSGTRFGVFMS